MLNLFTSQRRQFTVFLNPLLLSVVVFSLFITSCSILPITRPRKYPPHQPFVFSVNIKVEGNNLKPDEKKDLAVRLSNQLDDSLRIQIVNYAGLYQKIMYPPVFDTNNVRRSIGYMVALLNSIGYFTTQIKDTIRRDTARNHNPKKWRHWAVNIDFTVLPGKQLKLDSIGYSLSTPALQALAMQSRSQSLLNKGNPYSKALISAELDRLVTLFRNNGYFYFSKDDLYVERDTVVAALIDPNLDPFRQAELLQELQQKREKPTINVVILQRPVKDSTHIRPDKVGHITVYPDLSVRLDDSVTVSTIDTSTAHGITLISHLDRFKPKVLTNNIYITPGQIFRQDDYIRTLNRFSQMGAWQQASFTFTHADSSDSVINGTLRLYPAKKQYLNADYEISRNTNDIVTATNLFGVNLNLGLRNRNAYKQSVLTSTTLRCGVELGSDFIQTTQASISHSISFPRQLPDWHAVSSILRLFGLRRPDSLRTVINGNASYIDRRSLFTMQSVNASFGYEWNRNNKSYLWRPINIEYTKLNKTDSFQHYLDSIPSLSLAFKSGLVLSQQFVYKSLKQHGKRTNFLTLSAESSGALFGLSKSIDKGDLWRFIKGEIDYRHHIDYRRSHLAFHAYAGAGLAYGREGDGWEKTLPFYKAFFAGGPNSMRGWQVRQLGLGSSKFYDTAKGGQLDRFGDIQLEGNIEYRFPLGSLFGIKLLSAIYIDAGDIWDRRPIDTTQAEKGSDFQLNRFYKEIAIDAGTGLRFDFDWFLIRFDYAYKIKDPQSFNHPQRWFDDVRLFNGQFQLGIGYPF